MADMYMDVDVALAEVPVNMMPLLDDGDFKTRETAVAYDAAGMDLRWNFVTTGGAFTSTAVTPTTSGDYDWAHQGDGMYSIEIPASGGASINNDTEGFGWFTGVATGVLPWRGPVICFRPARLNNLFIDDANLFDDLFRVMLRADADIATDAAATLSIINADRGSGAGAYDNTEAPTAELTADGVLAVWDRATADLDAASSIGKLLVDNVNATISSRASQTSVDDVPTAAENAAAYLDLANGIETGLTPRQAQRLLVAAAAGKLSGAATTTIVIRNAVADSKDRITATVDADGNRSAITLDLT